MPMHLSLDIQQFMGYSYIQAGSQQLLAIQMVNTGASTVDGDIGTTFLGQADPVLCMCFNPCAKGFQL